LLRAGENGETAKHEQRSGDCNTCPHR
jgi:hypothetical protein